MLKHEQLLEKPGCLESKNSSCGFRRGLHRYLIVGTQIPREDKRRMASYPLQLCMDTAWCSMGLSTTAESLLLKQHALLVCHHRLEYSSVAVCCFTPRWSMCLLWHFFNLQRACIPRALLQVIEKEPEVEGKKGVKRPKGRRESSQKKRRPSSKSDKETDRDTDNQENTTTA